MAKASEKKPVQKDVATKKEQAHYDNFRDGQWNLKYLKFVNAFLKQIGLTEKTAAEKAGIVRQTIYHWFGKDDAMLSSIENLINACGYKLVFSLEKKSHEVGDAILTINQKEVPATENDKRLDFLAKALDRYGIQRREAAEKLGLGYTALYYWFRNDDVFVSYIYKIAELYDLKVNIKIDPKD